MGLISELQTTEDGSLSRRDPTTGELFHNRAGAYSEALINYVRPSNAVTAIETKGTLQVLDACFGLGYNTWVLWTELIEKTNGVLNVTGIDADSSNSSFFEVVLSDPRFAKLKSNDHKLQCSLDLRIGDLRELLPKLSNNFDLIFHDPFSPSKMPELWTAEIFREYHRLLSVNQGRLLTYSSAAAVRGAMIEAGFTVFRTTALGGKSGGTLGMATEQNLHDLDISCVFPLSVEEQEKINSISGVPYRDIGTCDTRSEILQRRVLEQQNRSQLLTPASRSYAKPETSSSI